MQENQNVKKQSLVDNEAIRFELGEKLRGFFNKYLPKEYQYTAEELYAHITNETTLNNYKKVVKTKEDFDKRFEIYSNIINENNLKPLGNAPRLAFFRMNLENTEKAQLENKKFIEKVSTEQGYMEYVDEMLHNGYEFDCTKLFPNSASEALDTYLNNRILMEELFPINGSINYDGQTMNPLLLNNYKSSLGIIECANNVMEYKNYARNPLSILIPEKVLEKNFSDIIFDNYDEIEKIINEYKNKLTDFEVNESKTPELSEFGSSMMFIPNVKNTCKVMNTFINNKTLDKNLMIDKQPMYKGNPVTYGEIISKVVKDKENVSFAPVPEKEVQTLKSALKNKTLINVNENITNDYKALFDGLVEQAKIIEESKGLLTRDTKDFKNLNTSLNKLALGYIKWRKETQFDESKIKDTANQYLEFFAKNASLIKDVHDYSKIYSTYKTVQSDKLREKHKTLNERSKNRLKASNKINDLYKNIDVNGLFKEYEKDSFKKSITVDEAHIKDNKNDLSKEKSKNLEKSKDLSAHK